MSRNLYIADLHLGHANVIRFDKRPFSSVEEMDAALISNWNNAVRNDDAVYVLGDFVWKKESGWLHYLEQLKGAKVLIVGNHDPKNLSQPVKRCFQDIKSYKELDDGGRHVILCHYAIPFHKHTYDPNTYMLYGHVHTTREYQLLRHWRKQLIQTSGDSASNALGQFINVGCMMPWMDYTPRTLDEIISQERSYEFEWLQGGHRL